MMLNNDGTWGRLWLVAQLRRAPEHAAWHEKSEVRLPCHACVRPTEEEFESACKLREARAEPFWARPDVETPGAAHEGEPGTIEEQRREWVDRYRDAPIRFPSVWPPYIRR